ncbi:MAG: hypothetical protein HY043_06250 [Verrucomicrobia bacterium]|nr:hypothetical protein [Verrucomicrobiota bacterium]
MKAIECNGGAQPAGCVTHAGELWLPTTRGVAYLRPDDTARAVSPPLSRIEAVKVNQRDLQSAGKVPLRAGHHRVEFYFTAMTFQRAGKIQFRYQLENLDPGWIDAGPRRMAEYPNVPAGAYRFRVQAGTPEGLWEETGSSFALMLPARFYETTWFLVFCGAVLVAAAAGVYRFRMRFLRQIHQLEQEHAVDLERARIAKDMHDELGTNLMQISLLCARTPGQAQNPDELQRRFEDITATVREAFRSLSVIVWAVSPQHDKLESLVNYICKFAENYLRLAGIRCRLDLPENVPPFALSFARRQQLFLLIKEGLTNIVKHAHASEVWFRLTLSAEEIVFCVQDNGCGFNTALKSEFGNGLSNMRRRADEAGGRLEIHSAPGQGTTLRARLPVSPDIFPPPDNINGKAKG